MKIDSVTHFTDEIGVVEISTFREELTLVIPATHMVQMIASEQDGPTHIQILKRESSG